MTPDPYRKAYEKAVEDLTLIDAKFEQLNSRKKLVENLVMTLQPVITAHQQSMPETSPHSAMQSSQVSQEMTAGADASVPEPPVNYSFLDVPAPLPESDGDPFERRTKSSFRFKGLSVQRSL